MKENKMFPSKDGNIISYQQPEPEFQSLANPNDTIYSLPSQTLSNIPSDIIIKTRIKYGSKSMAYKAILAEYCKNSSIHGIPYIFGIHRPFYEKFV